MGQYAQQSGGTIYLIENEADVDQLQVENPDHLAYVTQTTLSMDDTARIIQRLRDRFPTIQGPRKDDICYATQNRQDAVKTLSERCDLVLVVGSPNSSNSNRLRELAQRMGAQSYLIDGADQIDPDWLSGCQRVGVTAGASAPEVLVEQVITALQRYGASPPQEMQGIPENVTLS